MLAPVCVVKRVFLGVAFGYYQAQRIKLEYIGLLKKIVHGSNNKGGGKRKSHNKIVHKTRKCRQGQDRIITTKIQRS